MPESDEDVQKHWDDRYAEKDRIWSGRVNAQLANVAEPLPPGRALDLGCGEGGDAVWLAEHGWQVLAVDVSETALSRAAAEARSRGVLERIDFQHHDLSESFPEGTFDLASAQYFHSFVRLERPQILRRAAAAVRPGGLLVIVDHAAAPPWAKQEVHDHPFPSADDVLTELDLSAAEWERVRVETVDRPTIDPDGNPASIQDNLMVLRRAG
ncbi:class I SAM-dependent methyltransferase [Mycolicibacterium arenosum]|uniref:Class I SAM-dependent methyltransferase n=1 Tax=Mycolicibacterium arenosum TaxID=2952157 RepID=A0ABT1MCW6_9MYCO|nr:class I SAM-dependent methyltransferase [Mycolicibacterium sp. CAU 1645]MCP9276390.1 class I SAM-dependent methyltransferase [Mycolicibacterium sp. CAU 1645]